MQKYAKKNAKIFKNMQNMQKICNNMQKYARYGDPVI